MDHIQPTKIGHKKNCKSPSHATAPINFFSLPIKCGSCFFKWMQVAAEIIVPDPGQNIFIIKQIMCQGGLMMQIFEPSQTAHSSGSSS